MNTLVTLRRAVFIISLPFGILHFVLPIYGKEIGADAIEIGLFFSAFSLMTVLFRPIVGAGLDRFGRRPFLIGGLVGYAATMFMFAISDQIWLVAIARTFQGVASAFLWLAARAITADVAPPTDRGRSFGSVDQAAFQGSILGTFIGFAVLLPLKIAQGWKPLFLGYAIVSLLGVIIAFRNLPETNPIASNRIPGKRRRIPWSRPWALLLLVTAVTGASWAMISPLLMIFLQEKLAADVNHLALAYLPAAIIWASLPDRLGRLADRFGRKPMMVLGLAAAAISSFFIPHLNNLAGLAALWAFQALCYAAGDPAEQALVADLTGGDQRGRAFGMYTLAAGFGATLGPLLGGWLYESTSTAAPFLANGVTLAICALVLAIYLQVPTKGSHDIAQETTS